MAGEAVAFGCRGDSAVPGVAGDELGAEVVFELGYLGADGAGTGAEVAGCWLKAGCSMTVRNLRIRWWPPLRWKAAQIAGGKLARWPMLVRALRWLAPPRLGVR